MTSICTTPKILPKSRPPFQSHALLSSAMKSKINPKNIPKDTDAKNIFLKYRFSLDPLQIIHIYDIIRNKESANIKDKYD